MTTPTAVTEAVQLIFNAYGGKGRTGVDILRGKRMGFISTPLFDSVASEQAKEAGMALAAKHKREALDYARGVAERLARQNGVVNADDVARVLASEGREGLGNAAGSLFTDRKKWVFTGRLVKSARVNAHSNLLREWRLK